MHGNGENEELIKTIREIHDGVYSQGKYDGATEFVSYLITNDKILDGYEQASVLHWLEEWRKNFGKNIY